ncbi:MAG: preprotein translocase subunit SecE [Chitinophagales bacterium]|nr:preprotein translocase subunit SecE [Chitinophagales bacterium]
MNKVIEYVKESINEVKSNVTWTSMAELQKFTTIVIVSLLILTVIIWILDKASEFIMLDTIYKSV